MLSLKEWLKENNYPECVDAQFIQSYQISYLAYCVKYLNEELIKIKE